MTEQEAGELPELTALSLPGLLALAVTACFASPPPPFCDSSCRDSKVPVKVASYGNTEVIIFHCNTTISQPGSLGSSAQKQASQISVTLQVIELVGCGPRCLGVSNSVFVFSACVFAPDVNVLPACLSTE